MIGLAGIIQANCSAVTSITRASPPALCTYTDVSSSVQRLCGRLLSTPSTRCTILVLRSENGVALMVTLRIETTSRWDALALAGRLARYPWYLVEPDACHWDVCVPLDEPASDLPPDLRSTIELWLRERKLELTTVQAGKRSFSVGRAGA